jgi:hypothetical protein
MSATGTKQACVCHELPHCHQPLIEIDHYGERLIGCIECNRWGHPGDKQLVMELKKDDLEALRATRRSGTPHEQ